MEKLGEPKNEFEYDYKKEGWSDERIKQEIEELKQHPLFCQDLSNLKDNEELAALQSLLYDDEKEDELEMANTFKKQGDEIFKDRLMPVLKKGNLEKIKDVNVRTSLKGID
jgi:hypothetical protein